MSEKEKYIFDCLCKFKSVQYYSTKNKVIFRSVVEISVSGFRRSLTIPKRIYYCTIPNPTQTKLLRVIKIHSSWPSREVVKKLYVPFWYREVNSLIENIYNTYKPKEITKGYVSDEYEINAEKLIRDHKIRTLIY